MKMFDAMASVSDSTSLINSVPTLPFDRTRIGVPVFPIPRSIVLGFFP